MIVRVLPDQVVNQIAAGEVVERPASVVKELVENSLDAGATRVEVLLSAGGSERIRVSDDGSGMDGEDAMMCLERHATSKIRGTDDLERIASLGFRGEAIPSIASVSRFTIRTRTADTDEGVRVEVEGGELRRTGAVGCPVGTSIDVRDLFFNLPARRKFLRTRATELAHCVEAVARQALVRPDVGFRITHDGRTALSAEPTDLAGRARQVLGRDANQLVPVAFSRDGIDVAGLISPLSVHRPSGRALYLFVNGRYVRDAVVRRALLDAYRDRIPRGRTPLVVLELRLDPSRVDVNVHPAKTEVRFHDPRGVQVALSDGVREALDRHGQGRQLGQPRASARTREAQHNAPSLPLQTAPPPPRPSIAAHPDDDPLLELPAKVLAAAPVAAGPRPAGARTDSPVLRPPTPPAPLMASAPSVQPPPRSPSDAARPPPIAAGVAAEPPPGHLEPLRLIGSFSTRWAVCEEGGELVIYDYAAGEALLAEQRLREDGRSDRLLVPSRQRLTEKQVATLLERAEALAALGLELTQLAPTELAIRAAPRALPRLQLTGLLARLADAPASEAARTLATSQVPPAAPDAARLRAMIRALGAVGQSCEVRRIPARDLERIG